jgi:hypothetical protein
MTKIKIIKTQLIIHSISQILKAILLIYVVLIVYIEARQILLQQIPVDRLKNLILVYFIWIEIFVGLIKHMIRALQIFNRKFKK